MSLDTALAEKLDKFTMPITETGCWIWIGTISGNGYGRIYAENRSFYAHRYIYEKIKGKIDDWLQFDHKCRVRCCVNPDHLEPVELKENVRRGNNPSAIHARKTHCKRGHPFSGKNLHITTNGHRMCLKCMAMHAARYRAIKKQKELQA